MTERSNNECWSTTPTPSDPECTCIPVIVVGVLAAILHAHTAGSSDHRLGVHLLDTEEETKTECEDQFKVKMHVLMTKKIQYYANDPLIGRDHR